MGARNTCRAPATKMTSASADAVLQRFTMRGWLGSLRARLLALVALGTVPILALSLRGGTA